MIPLTWPRPRYNSIGRQTINGVEWVSPLFCRVDAVRSASTCNGWQRLSKGTSPRAVGLGLGNFRDAICDGRESLSPGAIRSNGSLTIGAAYGGREEIVDAVKAMLCEQAKSGTSIESIAHAVTPDAISRHLYSVDLPEPDLIIRTSGEIRLSGFLLWQSAFSEFYFSDVDWPAFHKIDFLRAIRSYQQRQRRFGW
jgi:hypothetical protein